LWFWECVDCFVVDDMCLKPKKDCVVLQKPKSKLQIDHNQIPIRTQFPTMISITKKSFFFFLGNFHSGGYETDQFLLRTTLQLWSTFHFEMKNRFGKRNTKIQKDSCTAFRNVNCINIKTCKKHRKT
jgi:hypothetical protein